MEAGPRKKYMSLRPFPRRASRKECKASSTAFFSLKLPFMEEGSDLYACLGVDRDASATLIRRAWRLQATKHHPDRPGGSASAFSAAQRAFQVLSDPERRRRYDASGLVESTVSEDFTSGFGSGAFAERPHATTATSNAARPASAQDQLMVLADGKGIGGDSHSAGFEAWLRSRAGANGGGSDGVFNAEAAALQFGVAQVQRRSASCRRQS